MFKSNPLAEFVELPYELSELDYNIVICGAIRGALQMLQMSVECQLVRDEVKGSAESEIRLTLKEVSANGRMSDRSSMDGWGHRSLVCGPH